MKESTRARLLMFGVGFPAVILVPYLFPQNHYLVLSIFVCGMSTIGAFELETLIRQKGLRHPNALVGICGLTPPLVSYLIVSGFLPQDCLLMLLALLVSVFILYDVFANKEQFDSILMRAASGLLLVVYPGFLITYIARIADFSVNQAMPIQLWVYFTMVFGNDSFAYVTGMLFGKKRGIIAISPAKSLAGFIGGFVTSIVAILAAWFAFPQCFPGPIWKCIILGVVIGILTIVGDLAESALKRSANVKDSGAIMPGRGGILDSIDSVVITAPAFFYLYYYLFIIL